MELNKQVSAIKLEKSQGLIVLILGILFGGFATIYAGFVSKNEADKKPAIIIGLVQWIASVVLIGWIWAIWTSWLIYKNSQ